MRQFDTLHAKILLGYCVVGGIFIALVANALVQFRSLEDELIGQQQVVAFYDAVRDARRLEKNFLLYRKISDLRDALEAASSSLDAVADIRASGRLKTLQEDDLANAARYRDLLSELLTRTLAPPTPEALLDEVYAAGVLVLRFGEALDETARERVKTALSRHDANLIRTIWAALILALVTGLLVTRSVLKPLREIELSLQRVASGETGRLDERNVGGEVESLTRSINDTIHELEVRQESQARSSRLMALGTMLAGVAHELNNPLSNISSSCQILQEELEELTTQASRQLLGQIDHQVLRAQRIVSALLDFSGSRSIKQHSEKLRELVDEAITSLRHQINQPINSDIDINGDLEIYVDRMRFQQVLLNIIKNAVEAMPPGCAVGIRAWKEVSSGRSGVILEVADKGSGLHPDHLGRVFDPFFTTKPEGQGTGLGLSVAYEIVLQHGGILSANARTEGGLCFRIQIPDRAD